MAGHVAVRQVSVLGLDQYLTIGADQDCAERMVAVPLGTSCHIEGAAQQGLMIEERQ